MDLLAKLEKLSEKLIEGIFQNRAAGHLQPVEIAARLYSEMKDKKQVSLTRVYVPNEYHVYLNPGDRGEISPLESSLTAELAEYLARKAGEKDFHLTGPLVIKLVEEEGLNPGQIRVEGHFSEAGPAQDEELVRRSAGSEAAPLEQTQVFTSPGKFSGESRDTRAELVILQGSEPGFVFRLQPRRMVLGRRSTNDIFLDDPQVSRRHAEITFDDGAYFLTDLGSLNGTYVNKVRINQKKLEPGDKITMGAFVLEFRVV